MGKTYEKANQGLHDKVVEVVNEYHPTLRDAEVAVDVMLAFAAKDKNGDPTGPAIKDGRYPCKAKVHITNLKERAFGHGDAEILLDGDTFDEWPDADLVALLDHELTHLEFSGERDDLDRPKLKIRPHDRHFGWFDEVAERHGEHAFEVQQAERMFGDTGFSQLYLAGLEPVEA